MQQSLPRSDGPVIGEAVSARRHQVLELVSFTVAGALIVWVAWAFSFREGLPGFRHDWIWPSDLSERTGSLIALLSAWDPRSFGNGTGIGTLNLIQCALFLCGLLRFDEHVILFIFMTGWMLTALLGMSRLVRDVAGRCVGSSAWFAGYLYAFSPIAFQKSVAGHIYFLAGYAALPWFMLFIGRAMDGRRRLGNTAAAGLVAAVASTQVQFAAFCGAAALAMLICRRPSWQRVGVTAGSLVPCLAQNLGYIVFSNHTSALVMSNHMTRQWELNLSSQPGEALALGGYLHYDIHALPPSLLFAYALGRWLAVALAFGALLSWRSPTVRAAGLIGLVSWGMITGMYGPLASAIEWGFEAPDFAYFRELYHAASLYALAIALCMGVALASLPRRWREGFGAVVVLATLPFVTGGLNRMVPTATAVAMQGVSQSGVPLYADGPFEEPLRSIGSASNGLDPLRLDPSSLTAASIPFNLNVAVQTDPSVLADLGVGRVAWRRDVFSDRVNSFEPNVGARGNSFNHDQIALANRYHIPTYLQARPVVSTEGVSDRSALDRYLADAALPPGEGLPVLSSFDDNNVRRSWVSGSLWAWQFPEYANVTTFIVTRSVAPYRTLRRDSSAKKLYLLTAGGRPRVDALLAHFVGRAAGRYSWWIVPATDRSIEVAGVHAIARLIVSDSTSWTPGKASNRSSDTPTKLGFFACLPWSWCGSVPDSRKTRRLVLARSYSSAWHLVINGVDRGPSSEVHGVMNGWTLRPGDAGAATLQYAPESTTMLLEGIDGFILVIAAIAASRLFRRYV